MLRNYHMILLPNTKTRINDLSEKAAKVLFQWFLNIIPERLAMLKKAVATDDKNLATKLDYTPDSLVLLGEWFTRKISKRKKTRQEIAREESEARKVLPYYKAEQDWTLTSETISLCFDVGIYFAAVFLKRFKSIQWAYVTKPRSLIDRNWPLLEGFRVKMNPINLVITSAFGTLDGTYGSQHLIELYEIWVKELMKNWKKKGKTWIYIGPKKYQKYLMEWEKVGKK